MSRFDVVVIGGGPAGMMAAARAAQYGARVALVEKNKELGMKLMITGRGRCNFAHDEEDPELLSKDYRNGGEFLLPALKKFGTKETIAFFLRRGVVAAPERGHRIYPRDGQDASSVVNAMWTALKDGGVQVLRSIEVRNLDMLGNKARRLITTKQEIEGNSFIIATGGLSFPNTGSTGDGYRFARRAGHEIAETSPALCPVKIAEKVDSYLEGLKLKNVRVTLTKDGEQVDERFGEMDFTHFGISGAIIMDMASSVDEAMKSSPNVKIHIDLKPALEPDRLDARIGRDFEEFSTDALRFALRKMLPGQIIPQVIERAGLDLGKPCGQTTPEERQALRNTMKDYAVTPVSLLGFRHAIITRGGVKTSEIDPETMRSKYVPNLYFAGEVLDVDGPTGGYNLQACWSTGYVAGSAAAEALGFTAPTDDQIVRQMFEAQTKRDEAERAKKLEARSKAEEDAAKEAAAKAPLGVTADLQTINSGSDTEKDKNEDNMTIKTGPTDDKEFCGWKDPRKTGNAAATETPAAGIKKREISYSNARKGDRPRGDRDSFSRREDGEKPYRSRDDRESFRRRDDGHTHRDRDDGYRPRRGDEGRPYHDRDDRRGGTERRNYEGRPYRNSDNGDRTYRSQDDRYGEGTYRSDYRYTFRRREDDRPRRDRDEDYKSRYEDRDRFNRDRDDHRGDAPRKPYGDRPYRGDRGVDKPYRSSDRDDGYRPRRGNEDRPYHDRDDRRGGTERRNYEGRPYRNSHDSDRPYRSRDDRYGEGTYSNRDEGYRSRHEDRDRFNRDRDDRRNESPRKSYGDKPYRDGRKNGSPARSGETYDGKHTGKNRRYADKTADGSSDYKRPAAKVAPEKAAENSSETTPRKRRFTNFEQFRKK